MYFVDQSNIEETLLYMEKILDEVSRNNQFDSFKEKLSLERMIHMLIESIIDAGNMMIDGFIMRDPGGYEDIIDILVDEKVIPAEEEADYKTFIRLRKALIHEYRTIDHTMLRDVMLEKKETLQQFSVHVRSYLKNALEVANAFSNE
ncbi:DUF86 domain-containing protein [Oceanobacillus sp. 143]|uniref:DUF86 domain-containing protein n=1 Tax=Oceanobacillus zhaokaii TaxID=2052660 RepID=A0A345PIN2_9BACI|nr:DUF86 domain-containing protein [Oceanobacillus zhaokaii]AXI09862.1 DUF86 domain-containing protein [Oceanobacillus zhaokaii]QGS69100.1 DUF86 domain-containing protein [Oceanobacillus sp. 143]